MSMEKIAKLLRQAEGTHNEAEAEAFMAKAQELATRFQISLAAARAHTAVTEVREEPEARRIVLSRPRTMGASTYVDLFDAVGRPNNVQLLISHDSTTVFAHGFPSDIDMTEALYLSLVMQMRQAADAFLRTGEHRTETVYRPSSWTSKGYRPGREVPVSGRTARISFQRSFAYKVGTRLREAKATALQTIAQEETAEAFARDGEAAFTAAPSATSAELVLKGREVQAAEFFKTETSHIKRSWKGGSSSSHSSTAAARGREAGARARLGSEKAIGGSRAQVSAAS